jgi:RHS repeat-associated protein
VSERLIQTNDGSATFNNTGTPIAQYAYDPFGRRTITVSYGWAPNGTWGTAPIYKRDHAGQSGAVNNQGSAAGTGSNAANGIEHYYHHDHLGTPIRLTNQAGETTWRAVSEAFGRTTIDTSIAPITTGTTTNHLRFPGQYEDQETGTHYNYFRDYDPQTGRYVQSDPIGLNGGVNTYSYALNTPLNAYDPDGRFAWLVKLCGKGYQKVRKLSKSEAVQKARDGENILVDGGLSEATKLAKKASKGGKIHKHKDGHAPFNNRHLHPGPHPGKGHIFYSIAAGLTATHYFEGCDCIGETLAPIVDMFNPLSIPQEIINIVEEED